MTRSLCLTTFRAVRHPRGEHQYRDEVFADEKSGYGADLGQPANR
jgi:hypothetical protein